MIRAVLGIARMDLVTWLRTPWLIAASLLPPLGMAVLVAVLTVSVGQQPVALVVEGRGPLAARLAQLFVADEEAYLLSVLSRREADRALADQRVAAEIVIPPDFDERAAAGDARVDLYLNNVDIDVADDIRRSVTRSVAEFDAPQLGILGELQGPSQGIVLPNPYRLAVAEHDVRATNVSFLEYQVVPILILVVISVGMVGTAGLASRDFERATAKVLLLAPRPRTVLVLGRLLGGVVSTAAVLGPVLAAAAAAGILRPPAGHWWALAALLLALTVFAAGAGLAIGSAVRRTRLVAMVTLNAATYLFFLGGGFTTVAFLPAWIQAASRVVPTSYAIEGLRQALFYPDLAGFEVDLLALGIAAAAAAAAGVVALSRSWRRA